MMDVLGLFCQPCYLPARDLTALPVSCQYRVIRWLRMERPRTLIV